MWLGGRSIGCRRRWPRSSQFAFQTRSETGTRASAYTTEYASFRTLPRHERANARSASTPGTARAAVVPTGGRSYLVVLLSLGGLSLVSLLPQKVFKIF